MRILTAREFLDSTPATPEVDAAVASRVQEILRDVQTRGDEALREWTRKLDNVDPVLVVPNKELRAAWTQLPHPTRKALTASANMLRVHQEAIQPRPATIRPRAGLRLDVDWTPLRRVGAYAPGGRAAYPSTVIMNAIPAKVAGVEKLYLASPPGPSGRPASTVLAAAYLSGVDGVYAMGGAQAIAAFAYGTRSVPRVDKIVGPGNAYVREAKRQVIGAVGIDSLAGPSELAIVLDKSSDLTLAAFDLAAQAEHDPQAAAIVVTTDRRQAEAMQRTVENLTPSLARKEILATSLGERGRIVLARNAKEIVDVVDHLAPEHVQLPIKNPDALARRLRTAGTIFEGEDACASLGDYATGANHVLPTAGAGRWTGPLSVYDFLRQRVRQRVNRVGLRALGPIARTIAECEGLPNHAAAVQRRLDR